MPAAAYKETVTKLNPGIQFVAGPLPSFRSYAHYDDFREADLSGLKRRAATIAGRGGQGCVQSDCVAKQKESAWRGSLDHVKRPDHVVHSQKNARSQENGRRGREG